MSASARAISIVYVMLFSLAACDGYDSVPTENAPPQPKPASIVATSASAQSGIAYEYLAEALAVRVADSNGQGLAGIDVTWTATSGGGYFCSDKEFPCTRFQRTTNTEGIAKMWFRPSQGLNVIEASVPGLDMKVRFDIVTAENPPLVRIMFGPLFDCMPNDPSIFIGADATHTINVSVGTIIEFQYEPGLGSCTARLVASSAPEGGEVFDSGIIPSGGTFHFTPKIAGTWLASEILNGGSITITAN